MAQPQRQAPTAQLTFPNRENVTTGQLANVLQVVGLSAYWIAALNRKGDEDEDDSPKDSEAKIALENTLVKACARLDRILADDKRWTIEYQMGLEAEFKKSHASNLAFLEAQRKASEEISTPHFQWRPTIMKSEDGAVFIALLGDPEKPNEGIVGLGRTPEEALTEFDKNFRGKENSPEMIAFLKRRAEEQKNYEPNTVDDGRNSNAGPTSGEQNSSPEDSVNPQQKRSVRERVHSTLGPEDPRNAIGSGEEAFGVGLLGTPGDSQEARTPFIRKIGAFLSRCFRLDKSRARR